MHWSPPIELSEREELICARLSKQRRFFPFLRRVRHRLFDTAFQKRLASMYSDRPRGTPPKPPAFLATVVLLQAYTCCSDFRRDLQHPARRTLADGARLLRHREGALR
jgi:transposase